MVAASPLCIRALYLTANTLTILMGLRPLWLPELSGSGEGMRAALIGCRGSGAYFVGRMMRSQLYHVAAVETLSLSPLCFCFPRCAGNGD